MSLTKFLGTKKKLNAYFNNIRYFRQYSMEYRKTSIHSNRNPNKKLSQKSKKLQNWKLNSNTEWQDKYLWDIEYLIEQMITERVLLNYFHAKEGLVKWLQINDKNLYLALRKQQSKTRLIASTLKESIVANVSLLRLIFKNNTTSYQITRKQYQSIAAKCLYLYSNKCDSSTRRKRRMDAWKKIQEWRYEWNKFVTENDVFQLSNLGLTTSNRAIFSISETCSIYTHFAILCHQNKINVFRLLHYQQMQDIMSKLRRVKIDKMYQGRGNRYTVPYLFQTLDIMRANKLNPNTYPKAGCAFLQLLGEEFEPFVPNIPSTNTIRKAQRVQIKLFEDCINSEIIPIAKGYKPINCSMDFATLKGSACKKLGGFLYHTPHPTNELLSVSWGGFDLPRRETKEDATSSGEIMDKHNIKYPAVTKWGLNQLNTDRGTTEYAGVAEYRREEFQLCIWGADSSHIDDNALRVASKGCFGVMVLNYGGIVVKQTRNVAIAKLLIKTLEKDNDTMKNILSYSTSNEYVKGQAASGTRHRGNVHFARTFITKRRVRSNEITNNVNEDSNHTYLVHNLYRDMILLLTKPEDMMREDAGIAQFDLSEEEKKSLDEEEDCMMDDTLNLPRLSDIDHSRFEFVRRTNSHTQYVMDQNMLHLAEASEIKYVGLNPENLVLDLNKCHVFANVMAEKELYKRDKNAQLLFSALTNRIDVAGIIIEFCVGNETIVKTINMAEMNFNRCLELLPLKAKVYELLGQYKQCAKYMLQGFTIDDIYESMSILEEHLTFKEGKECGRLLNCTGFIPLCKKPRQEGFECCPKHLQTFEDDRFNIIATHLPSIFDAKEKTYIAQLFKGYISPNDELTVDSIQTIMIQHFYPILSYTTSEMFESYEDIDGITTRIAKCITFVQLYRYISYLQYKYSEGFLGLLVPAICAPILLRNPFDSLLFGGNLLEIGLDCIIDRCVAHLYHKKRHPIKRIEFEAILQKKIDEFGYAGGMRICHTSIWSELMVQKDCKDFNDYKTKCQEMYVWSDQLTKAWLSSMPIESGFKHAKKIESVQAQTSELVYETTFHIFNMHNNLHWHPNVIWTAHIQCVKQNMDWEPLEPLNKIATRNMLREQLQKECMKREMSKSGNVSQLRLRLETYVAKQPKPQLILPQIPKASQYCDLFSFDSCKDKFIAKEKTLGNTSRRDWKNDKICKGQVLQFDSTEMKEHRAANNILLANRKRVKGKENKTSQPAAKKRKLNGNESDVNFINDANMDYQSDNDADDEDEDELEPMTSEYENTVTRRYALRSRVVN
eukprot:47355_1